MPQKYMKNVHPPPHIFLENPLLLDHLSMKTPSVVTPLFVSFLARRRQIWPHVSHDIMMSHRNITWHHMTKWIGVGKSISNFENHVFHPSDLDLWPYPRCCQGQHLQFWVHMSNGSPVRVLTDEHTHTDRPDRFYTLDSWCRRDNLLLHWKMV